jgi:hypothetical protein
VRGRPQLAQVLDRDDHLEVERLADPRVDELDLPTRARDEAPDLGERTLGRRQADALERLLDEALEPLEREREVSAALRARDPSTITVWIPRRFSRACDVSRWKSDSGVVIRMSGGVLSMRLRSSAGVSPVRTATESSERSPASGLRRFRSMS